MKTGSIDSASYVVSVKRPNKNSPVSREASATWNSRGAANENRSELSPERLALIRKRIAENYYDQDEILRIVAGRMAKSRIVKNMTDSSGEDTA